MMVHLFGSDVSGEPDFGCGTLVRSDARVALERRGSDRRPSAVGAERLSEPRVRKARAFFLIPLQVRVPCLMSFHKGVGLSRSSLVECMALPLPAPSTLPARVSW